jgi:hypothetical protein
VLAYGQVGRSTEDIQIGFLRVGATKGFVATRDKLEDTRITKVYTHVAEGVLATVDDFDGLLLTAQVPTQYLESLALKLLEFSDSLEVLEPRALQEAFIVVGKRAVALGKRQPRKILCL